MRNLRRMSIKKNKMKTKKEEEEEEEDEERELRMSLLSLANTCLIKVFQLSAQHSKQRP